MSRRGSFIAGFLTAIGLVVVLMYMPIFELAGNIK